MTEQTVQEGKTLAVIGYLTIIGSIIAYFLNNDKKNPFAAFHIRQGLGLCLMYMIFGFVTASFDSWLISIGFWYSLVPCLFMVSLQPYLEKHAKSL